MKIAALRPKALFRLNVFLVITSMLLLIAFKHRVILDHIKTDTKQAQSDALIQPDIKQVQPEVLNKLGNEQAKSGALIQPGIQQVQPEVLNKLGNTQVKPEAVALGNMCRQTSSTLKIRAQQLAKRGDSTNAAQNAPEDKYDLDVYPVNGTGTANDISTEFDADVFNSFCKTNNTLRAVLAVYTSPNHFESRDILRRTLGRWALKLNCKMFFIVGVTLNQTIHRLLQKEYVQEKDILMMPKVDAYMDLNNKAVTMIEWISRYCMQVPYVIHLIDDAYVNIEMFLRRLESIKDDNYMLGGLKSFQQGSFFTGYLIGFAYAFPTSIVKSLLSVVHTARYCWIEDVWFTGTVREAAGVKIIPINRSQWMADHNKPFGKRLDGLPPYFMIHSLEKELFPKLYSTVIN